MQIRLASPEHAQACYLAEREIARHHPARFISLPHEFSLQSFMARIDDCDAGNGIYLVCLEGEKLVGHASLIPMPLTQVRHVYRLDMCIHEGHWRRGYGSALLGELLAWAAASPEVLKVELLVRATNFPAIALYEKFGFAEEGRFRQRVRLADGSFVDDVAMGKVLGDML